MSMSGEKAKKNKQVNGSKGSTAIKRKAKRVHVVEVHLDEHQNLQKVVLSDGSYLMNVRRMEHQQGSVKVPGHPNVDRLMLEILGMIDVVTPKVVVPKVKSPILGPDGKPLIKG